MSHIQINQQPSHCSHASMTVTAPFSSVPVLPLANAVNHLPQALYTHTFVKFLSKQIKICQRCHSGYQRGLNGDTLPPPYVTEF